MDFGMSEGVLEPMPCECGGAAVLAINTQWCLGKCKLL